MQTLTAVPQPRLYRDAHVLSIRQPWAWLILHGGKDVENRNWPTAFRGRFLIHAAAQMTQIEYQEAGGFAWTVAHVSLPLPHELHRGGIIGDVELVDCLTRSPSVWFVGIFGFLLRFPQPLPFVRCAGRLGFWKTPQEGYASI